MTDRRSIAFADPPVTRKKLLTLLLATMVGSVLYSTTAYAQGTARARGLSLVSNRAFNVELADIWVHGQTAYLGTRTCGAGVQAVDVSNPAAPRSYPAIVSNTNSNYEDVVVIDVKTSTFEGALMAVGLQACRENGSPGVEFWDVTNPAQPRRLSFSSTGVGGVHELSMFQRGDRVYALLAVPFSELAGTGGDLRIIDATDPERPISVIDWGIQGDLGLDPTTLPQGLLTTTYLHSVAANPEGTTAYLSYWDAGVLMLDISDPAKPVYLGRTTYAASEEGNAHSISLAKSGNLLLVNDEDYNPAGAVLEVDSPSDLAGPVLTLEQPLGRPMCTVGPIGADAAYLGQACTREAFISDPSGKIAVAEMGGCPVRDKVLAAQQAGARALLLISNFPTRLASATGDPRDITIPVAVIPLRQGRQIRAALNRGQSVNLRLGPEPNASWGYLRIFDTSRVQEPKQISTFATENSRRCPPQDGGTYTIHNTVVVGDTVYASWYSDGVRVIDISDAANPRETGFYVPPDRPDRKTSTWGVFVANDLVYLSDITTGLHILQRTAQ